jgi:hypothetical protein
VNRHRVEAPQQTLAKAPVGDHFIHKNGTVMGEFKLSRFADGAGASKNAFFVSEQFRFYEDYGHGGSI